MPRTLREPIYTFIYIENTKHIEAVQLRNIIYYTYIFNLTRIQTEAHYVDLVLSSAEIATVSLENILVSSPTIFI